MKKPPSAEATRNPRRASSAKPAAVEARRQALVRAAFEIIAESGFEGLRTRDTATRAGVTVTTLHYYFEGKEALVQGVGEYLKQLLQTIPLIASEHSALLSASRSLLSTTVFQFQQEPKAFIVLSEFLLRSLRDPSLRSIMQELDEGWRSGIALLLEDGIRQNLIRSDIDVPTTATTVVAFIKGMALQSAINARTFEFKRGCTQFDALLRSTIQDG